MSAVGRHMREPGGRLSAPRWLVRLIQLLVLFVAASAFAPGAAQAAVAPAAPEFATAAAALPDMAAETLDHRASGDCGGDQHQPGNAHAGCWCAHPCGAGCGLALADAGGSPSLSPAPAPYLGWKSAVFGSIAPNAAFRPPRFFR